MAIVIPDSAFGDTNITDGEKKVLRTLRDALDDSVVIWYQPKLRKARRPDIIVYVPALGIVLYEVKDWAVDQILKANPDEWDIDFNSSIRQHTDPYKQASGYYYNLSRVLQRKKSSLISKDGKHDGKVKVPIAPAVVFPNIEKSDFTDRGYDSVIETEKCLFKDDIKSIQQMDSHKQTRDRLKEHFDPWWQNDELTSGELDELRGILYPEITSIQKDKGGTKKNIILDRDQEQVARKIGSGHSVIRGVAGSGKSLVLCSKALLMAREQPQWKVLIVCYNVSLASQLKYYIDSFQKREEVSLRNITIVNFHKLCSNVFREHGISFPKINRKEVLSSAQFASSSEDEQEAKLDEMESALLGQELQRIGATEKTDKFQAILVDESQDFHPSWLKGLLFFLDGKTNFLLLAEDPNQKIYPRSFSYKDAGIRLIGGGRSFRLPIGYRSTREIIVPASKLVTKSSWDEFYKRYIEDEGEIPSELAKFRKGAYPKVKVVGNYADICSTISSDISNKLSEGYKCSDFGILYLIKKSQAGGSGQGVLEFAKDIDYVGGIRGELATKSIPNFWMSENEKTKRKYDQFKDEVTISTIFSAKGLEFEVVYIVGLELYPWSKRNKRENASLLYVAMTRAKSELYMFSTEDTPYVEEIKSTIDEARTEAKAK